MHANKQSKVRSFHMRYVSNTESNCVSMSAGVMNVTVSVLQQFHSLTNMVSSWRSSGCDTRLMEAIKALQNPERPIATVVLLLRAITQI